MIRSRNKHVCNPGARRSDGMAWKRKPSSKARVLSVEKMPANYVPAIPDEKKTQAKVKRVPESVKEAIAKSSRSADGKLIPGVTITCYASKKTPPKTIAHRKIDRHESGDGRSQVPDLKTLSAMKQAIGKFDPLPPIEIVPYESYGAVKCKN